MLTTHYLEEADRLAERIATVDRGRIVVEGTPEEPKGQLGGDAVHLELRAETDRDAAVPRSPACPVCTRCWSRGAGSASAPRTPRPPR